MVAARSRPVHIERIAHASALGVSAASAACTFLAGGARPGGRELLGEHYPWFALPLIETDWLVRARGALGSVAAELTAGRGAPPLFAGSSARATGAVELFARRAARVDMPPDEEIVFFSRELAAAFGGVQPWLFSTACTSGFAALEAACALIGGGDIDEAIVLGAEFASDTALAGFAGLGLLARDADADGLILGEAVAGLRLSTRPGTGWVVAACRLGLDAFSATSPTPDGGPIAENIAAALADAGLTAADIDLLKPHRARLSATDEPEQAALSNVFGARRAPEITFKRHLGHTLGACGPAELTVLLALLDTPEGAARYGRPRHVLLNLVGFGGSLATVIVSRAEEKR
ncbi:MAG: hypothetical protein LBI92_05550 [Azoarcus sp.]|jgi:3-oxoacyl-[acyl-carrier-protein] synthase-1|nr:hypothetical protein [Azoarcus sp.]